MEIPPGMEASKDECLLLKKNIYRLLQSSRQLYVKLVESLKDCGFEGSQVDPCLEMKSSSSGSVLMVIYADNYLTIGIDKEIDEVIESLKAFGFGLKVENELSEYLSCKIVQEVDQNKVWIMQPHLI